MEIRNPFGIRRKCLIDNGKEKEYICIPMEVIKNEKTKNFERFTIY